jgi:hypothetical protein
MDSTSNQSNPLSLHCPSLHAGDRAGSVHELEIPVLAPESH